MGACEQHERSTMKTLTLGSASVVLAVALAGCAGAPSTQDKVAFARELATAKLQSDTRTPVVTVSEPKPVAIESDPFNPNFTAVKARVLADASVIDSKFATSLDPRVGTVTRLETSWTRRDEDGNQAWRIGDAVSTAGLWGSSVRYGGLQFGTRIRTREDVIASQRLASSGIAVLPSVADALFASAGAAHPELRGQNLSIDGGVRIAGPNALKFVARDSMGRAQSFTAPLVSQARVVNSDRTGCEDFSVGFGKVRRDYAISSNDYGPLFANTTVTCAAPLGFTIEGHGEFLSEELRAMGVGISRRLGVLGTASFAVASSRAEVGSGWLARFGFDHESDLIHLVVRTRTQSREFREVATIASTNPIMERSLATVGLKTGDSSSLALTYATQTTWDKERVEVLGLSQSMQLGRASVSMSAGHSLVASDGSSVFISFTRPFGILMPPRSTSLVESVEPLLDHTLQ